MFEVNWIINR